MAPSSRRRRGTFSAFRRPFVTDPIFWIAAAMATALGLVVSAGLMALGGSFPSSPLEWGVAAFFFVVAGWLSFKLLAMGLNTSRALEEPQVANEKRAATMETTGRTAGAVAGRGVAALVNRGKRKSAAQAPEPTAAAPSPTPPQPQPGPPSTPAPAAEDDTSASVDNAARVLGSMLGRRLADRRKDDD